MATHNNACGDLDDYPKVDREETITEKWTWQVDTDGKCGIVVEHEDGVNDLDEYAEICPGHVVVGNNKGRGEIKALEDGKTLVLATDILRFEDKQNPAGVTLAELVACCDDGDNGGGDNGGTPGTKAFNPIVVNFYNPDPAIGGFVTKQFSQTPQTVYIDGVTSDANGPVPFDPKYFRRDTFDIFDKEACKQEVTIPAGANRAAIFYTMNGLLTTGPDSPTDVASAFANINARIDISANRGEVDVKPSPLPTTPHIVTQVRIAGPTLGWDTKPDNWNTENINQRAPGHRATGNKIGRMSFQLSTEENPTILTFKPEITIYRGKGGGVSVGSGRLLIIPWYEDEDTTGFSTPALFDVEDPEDDSFDDGVFDPGFVQAQVSQDIKNQMNYMTNAINETLLYDTGLDPARKPALEQALREIFDLKRSTEENFDYYYFELDRIKSTIIDDVGFQFGFETDYTKKSI